MFSSFSKLTKTSNFSTDVYRSPKIRCSDDNKKLSLHLMILIPPISPETGRKGAKFTQQDTMVSSLGEVQNGHRGTILIMMYFLQTRNVNE